MKFVKAVLVITAGAISGGVLLWVSLAVGAADPARYLALARASCLLSGSLGILLGTIFARPRLTFSALALLAAGMASFWLKAD